MRTLKVVCLMMNVSPLNETRKIFLTRKSSTYVLKLLAVFSERPYMKSLCQKFRGVCVDLQYEFVDCSMLENINFSEMCYKFLHAVAGCFCPWDAGSSIKSLILRIFLLAYFPKSFMLFPQA